MKAMEQAIRTANETRDAGIASLEALSLQAGLKLPSFFDFPVAFMSDHR